MFGSRKKALKEELQEVKKHLQISGGIVADLADQKLHVEGCYSEMMVSLRQSLDRSAVIQILRLSMQHRMLIRKKFWSRTSGKYISL